MSDAEQRAATTTAPLAVEYEDFWYIKLRGPTDKLPLTKWGGYDQDFAEAPEVYSHDEVAASDHRHWGVVGIRDLETTSRSLLIFDLDVHKAPEAFDPSEVQVPDGTLIVRSQNGGIHVYFAIHTIRGAGKESEFEMTRELGWDIDIRGSFVNHHVVAPSDIPGVGGSYDVVNDAAVSHVFNPGEAVERITFRDDPLLAYQRERGGRGPGRGSIDIDLDLGDPPDDRPQCYHHGLELRERAPEATWYNPHRVNTLTALCGLGAGYDPETVIDHLLEEYPAEGGPVTSKDEERTEYHVGMLAQKVERGDLVPPSIDTLRGAGILADDESCSCPIPYHGDDSSDTDGAADSDDSDDSDDETPDVPRCPDCDWALGEHTIVDGNPALRQCSQCRVVYSADEVMR